ncbi:hypothetical protein ACQPYE_05505 [Actinosynnema sp. CA-299493]
MVQCVPDELVGSCGVAEESVGVAQAAQRTLTAGDGQAVVPSSAAVSSGTASVGEHWHDFGDDWWREQV